MVQDTDMPVDTAPKLPMGRSTRLPRACIAVDEPVPGICRGVQLINVVQGGMQHPDLLVAGHGAVEAARHAGSSFPVGVPWLPEFHDARIPPLLSTDAPMIAFPEAARDRARRGSVVTSAVAGTAVGN